MRYDQNAGFGADNARSRINRDWCGDSCESNMHMTKQRLGAAIVLILCAVAFLYFLARSKADIGGRPIWLLLAVPAILVARIAFGRLRRP